MGKGFLIDTNAVIDFTTRSLRPSGQQLVAEVLDDQPTISVIVKIELLGFPSAEKSIVQFVDRSIILSLDAVVTQQTILLRKSIKSNFPMPL